MPPYGCPTVPAPSPTCSFAWRDKCNRCGKSKGGGGGDAPPAAGGYDAAGGYSAPAGGYGGYDGAAAGGGYSAPRSEPVRAAPQGPPGGRGARCWEHVFALAWGLPRGGGWLFYACRPQPAGGSWAHTCSHC